MKEQIGMNDSFKEYFTRLQQILEIDGYNNAMIVSQWILDIMKKENLSLSEIEKILRSINSKIYLIGLPISFFKQEKYSFKIVHPFETKQLKYALWIEVNGLENLEQLLERNNLFNVDRSLTNTGFLGLRIENMVWKIT